jgi:hypothetical protein
VYRVTTDDRSQPQIEALITYLTLEDQQRVDILDVLWIG